MGEEDTLLGLSMELPQPMSQPLMTSVPEVAALLDKCKRVVGFTGAGISVSKSVCKGQGFYLGHLRRRSHDRTEFQC